MTHIAMKEHYMFPILMGQTPGDLPKARPQLHCSSARMAAHGSNIVVGLPNNEASKSLLEMGRTGIMVMEKPALESVYIGATA